MYVILCVIYCNIVYYCVAASSILRAGYATLLLAEHNNKSLNKVGMQLSMFEQNMFEQHAVDIFGFKMGGRLTVLM